jgi:hypothetical protein
MLLRRFGVLAVFILLTSRAVMSQGLSSLETDNLRLLYFDPTETYLVPHVTQSFENSLETQRRVFNYDPFEKITVLLTDFSDYGNAGAGSIPRNSVIVDIAPMPLTFETALPAERLFTIMNHELVHIANTDQAAKVDLRYRRLFAGKVLAISEHPESILFQYLTSPRKTTPRWYLEGMAVFMETWMAGGTGRAQGAYDEMVFRSMVRDDAHFYDPLGLVAEGTKVDFQVGANAYLYGGRFMSYIAYRYSPEKLIDWVNRTDGSRRNYRPQFEDVFGLPLNQAWDEWIQFEHEFQNDNLARIREYPTTSYRDLSQQALGSVSRAHYEADDNKLIAAFRYPGVVAHVGEFSLDDGSVRKVEDIKGPMVYRVTSLAYDTASKNAFYTADNYAYRDLMVLDMESGDSRMLLRDARIGEIVFNKADRSIWGVRHLNGFASLVRIPYPYTEWNLVHAYQYGEMMYDLDISPDGKKLSASFGAANGEQSIRIMDTSALLDGSTELIAEFDLGQSVPESFVFSPDGQFLFGSSYYTGVSNIWRYELATEELELVSNAETGFFRPLPLSNDELIVFRYTGQGFVPAIIEARPLEDASAIRFFGTDIIDKHPILETWKAGRPSDINMDEITTGEGYYVPVKNLGLESMYPILEGYKDTVALGLNINFSDPMFLDALSFSASYSLDSQLPVDERTHLSLDYRHAVISASPLAGTWKAGARYNYANFYDLFGPTKQALKGNWFYLGFDKTLLYDDPKRLNLGLRIDHFANLDRLPRYQNIDTTIGKLTSFVADLQFSHVKSSLGHVDDEKGFKWRLIAAADYVDSDTIPKFFGNFDFGFALPWKHSSIWFRNSAGVAFGEQQDEFANFFAGGFGNNYVDEGEIKRYRNEYALPGFELNEIFGRNFGRAMIELNLPPIRFRRIGSPGFYLSWARPAIFATTLVTNVDDDVLKRNVHDVGAQIDLRFTMMSRLQMTLSFGYAVGFGDGVDSADEFMLSLKIM